MIFIMTNHLLSDSVGLSLVCVKSNTDFGVSSVQMIFILTNHILNGSLGLALCFKSNTDFGVSSVQMIFILNNSTDLCSNDIYTDQSYTEWQSRACTDFGVFSIQRTT